MRSRIDPLFGLLAAASLAAGACTPAHRSYHLNPSSQADVAASEACSRGCESARRGGEKAYVACIRGCPGVVEQPVECGARDGARGEICADEPPADIEVAVAATNSAAYADTDLAPSPPADWPSHYLPAGGSESTSTSTGLPSWRLDLAVEPRVRIARLWIGAPISYSLSWLSLDQDLRITGVAWWDPVRLQALSLRKTGPAGGLSAAIRERGFGVLRAAARVQPYSVVLKDYFGIDCSGCRNSADVRRTTTMDSGVALGGELEYGPDWPYFDLGRLALFGERSGEHAWQVAAGWKIELLALSR